ncbi:MAG: CoA-disulfide reductase [Spirochaetae bacterium HGW-Spirochaetae-7]|jgi:NADPH-dependent 2,4-dienoyl-CoA reductase/sulfur reductase-like enzyme/rhodanese-related sulfurtransferase|nr:MAG: CoA-disulfide reductase [Spirochaetae bacterium HGW-Spirochaetae-7]
MAKEVKRLIIIGGVAAGATAAARAKRIDATASVTIVEAGRYVSFANCGLPYFISRDIEKRSELILQTPEGFTARYGVEVLLETRAISIDRAARTVTVRGPLGESKLPYDSLILAQGGSPFMPPIDGSDADHVFRLWTIPDMDAVHKFMGERSPASALVIGGGFIGLEAAEAFIARGLATTIVELTPYVMPPADAEFGAMIGKAFEAAGASVITGRSVKSLRKSADGKGGVAVLDNGTEISADVVLVSAGVKPNVDLAKSASLAIGPTGGLVVDEYMRTSDEHVWAAGDMVETVNRISGKPARVPLAGPANRQGRIAATNALGGSMRYAGAAGTSVFKVLEHTFAMTGLSEKAASALQLDAATATVHRYNHVSYYPGAEEMSLKIVYERGSGRLLGAQAFGKQGVDKRIDVAATAIAAGLGIDDLAELDLAYAPPFGAANDPMNMVAFVAQNAESGYAPVVSATEAWKLVSGGKATIVDVRTNGERRKAPVPGNVHIPLDEFDWRMEELPSGPLLLLSRAGYESHIALRKLMQAGRVDVKNISGGALSLALVTGFAAGTL